jgi:hypothetical protein
MKAVLAFAVLLAAIGAVPLSPRASQFRSGLDVVQVYATVRTSDGAFARDLVQHFDLAAFHALPGDEVEVVAHSVAGARKCTMPADDTRAIR